MNKKDKEEIQTLFNETLNENIVPVLEKLDKRTAKMEKDIQGLQVDVDSLNRKFDAQQVRLDRHDKRIQVLESASL